ncbi:hypothetical protein RB595_003471 [Gaeumannomyces hyphopodioides]
MKFLSVLAAAGAISPVVAMPAVKPRAGCTNPVKRVEWRQLSAADQQGYFEAVKCLKTKPSRIRLPSPLYDDFPYVHQKLNNFIHGGPSFLPWHRYFTHVYFSALAECGYQGPGTYWDWSLDYEGLRHSPVMSADRGFGGDGSSTRTETGPDGRATLKCVDDGPFSQLRPEYLAANPRDPPAAGGRRPLPVPQPARGLGARRLRDHGRDNQAGQNRGAAAGGQLDLLPLGARGGPAWRHTRLARRGNEPDHVAQWSVLCAPPVNPTTTTTTKGRVCMCVLRGDTNTKPIEPLFFLHHGQIDHLFWQWQQQNSSRLTEYGGTAVHYNETGRREATLDDLLVMDGLAADVKVRDIMDTVHGDLCYTY